VAQAEVAVAARSMVGEGVDVATGDSVKVGGGVIGVGQTSFRSGVAGQAGGTAVGTRVGRSPSQRLPWLYSPSPSRVITEAPIRMPMIRVK
jgi:hypothetical protein